jgi:D-alanine--poly(phosphoribitol) ligase subunit 1
MLSYSSLLDRAQTVVHEHSFSANAIHILPGKQSLDEYVQIWACLYSGKPFLALNPKFPQQRILNILGNIENVQINQAVIESLAYIISTSGSTGQPKQIPITQKQLAEYCQILQEILDIQPTDKVLQLGSLSFDISIMAMMMAWPNGACLCTVPVEHVLMAPRYAQDLDITVWLSVPSVIQLASQAGLLKPNSLPHLRLAIFGGEALSYQAAKCFSEAAPNARLFNFWGPSEGCISLSHFEIDRALLLEEFPSNPDLAVIPIGFPHPGVELALQDGEIIACSDQLTEGYLNLPALNQSQFFIDNGRRCYRTGDLGKFTPRYGYSYLGRVDRQIKLKGYRIELQECESALRQASGCPAVCVIPIQSRDLLVSGSAIRGLVGFIADSKLYANMTAQIERKRIIESALSSLLPTYMIPDHLIFLQAMPLTAHGKIDFKALENSLDEMV